MASNEEIKKKYPLHLLVWNNDHHSLEELLRKGNVDIELKDAHGRTPLMLCITLGHLESARVLLRHNANAAAVNKQNWSVTQESICTGDPELVRLTLQYRDGQRIANQTKMVTSILQKLKDSPDFYVEMKWEFTSWLPLVSRMCPSDLCRVWKSGANVRIDTTLMGVTGTNEWKRGNLSYVFRATESGATMDEINHEERTVYRHIIEMGQAVDTFSGLDHNDNFIAKKLTQPIFVTYVDTEKIEFERSKSGVLGWRSDRKETINNHECHVFTASNVQIVTLKRTEHLTEEDKTKISSAGGGGANLFGKSNPISNFLNTAEHNDESKPLTSSVTHNPCNLTPEEYFNPPQHHHSQASHRDVGRPKELTTKIKTFKAHLWLCQDYKLSLPDQVIPIIDLMAEYNPHFKKLKDFVTMQLPRGFPMKIEIPLYHILTAKITFNNLFANETPAMGVSCIRADSEEEVQSSASPPVQCCVDDIVFDVPPNYRVIVENSPGHGGGLDEEEQMLQMALQHSLAEYGGPEAAKKYPELMRQLSSQQQQQVLYYDDDEAMLQRAIAASLDPEIDDRDPLGNALRRSQLDQEEMQRLQLQEEEELKKVLELSLVEK